MLSQFCFTLYNSDFQSVQLQVMSPKEILWFCSSWMFKRWGGNRHSEQKLMILWSGHWGSIHFWMWIRPKKLVTWLSEGHEPCASWDRLLMWWRTMTTWASTWKANTEALNRNYKWWSYSVTQLWTICIRNGNTNGVNKLISKAGLWLAANGNFSKSTLLQ